MLLNIISTMKIFDLFSGLIGSLIGALITWKATRFLIQEQEKPIFTLIFKISGKNQGYFLLKIGIKNVGGTALNLKWKLSGDIPRFNLFDEGEVPIISKNETRFLFEMSLEDYKSLVKNDKILKLELNFNDKFSKTHSQLLPIDLYKMGDFKFVTDPNNKDLIEYSLPLYKKAKEEFENDFLKNRNDHLFHH